MEPQLKMMSISAEEVDHLCQKFEIRDHTHLMSWGVKFLYDLSKAEENGWHMFLQKSEINGKSIALNPDYRYAAFKLEWLSPDAGGQKRIPVENLEKLKVN